MTIKIAIQKAGRLTENSLSLLRSCDIHFEESRGSSQLKSSASDFPLEMLFVRDEDVPHYVADNVAQLGIVGENIIAEMGRSVTILKKLNFSHCRLSLAVPKTSNFKDLKDINGSKIATSYPNILQNFLDKNNIKAEIHVIKGSVEIAPSVGLADLICDLVGTGSTLMLNGLKEFEVIFRSQAVLVRSAAESTKENESAIADFTFRVDSVLNAANSRYMLLNAPANSLDKIIKLLPSLKSPTIIPLADNQWFSVHCVINTKNFWKIVGDLKKAGAEGILISPLEKIIP